jgi:hypothetical protein
MPPSYLSALKLEAVVMLGWWMVDDHLVICVLSKFGMVDHALAAMLDGV